MVEMRLKSGPGVTPGPPGEPCGQLREALGHWGVAREPKRDENGSYRIPPEGQFWGKSREQTSKKWVSRQAPLL